MRVLRNLLVAAVAAAAIGCQPSEPTAPARPAAVPAGPHRVVGGESNQFFTATSERSFDVAPGVRSAPIKDAEGRAIGVHLIARDNSTHDVRCECPTGCRTTGGGQIGCITIKTSPNGPYSCAGDCEKDNSSCSSCSLVSAPPPWPSSEASEPPDVAPPPQPEPKPKPKPPDAPQDAAPPTVAP